METCPWKPEFLGVVTHSKDSAAAIARASQVLSNKLYPTMVKANTAAQNLAVSPFSILNILAVLYIGAGEQTAEQIRSALSDEDGLFLEGLEGLLANLKSDDSFKLEVANGLYAMTGYPLLKAYSDKVKKHLFATAKNMDFSDGEESSKRINQWVEKKTKDKISNLFSPRDIHSLTRMVLVNALYFKGDWLDRFDAEKTEEEDFRISDTKTVRVKMMRRSAKYAFHFNRELSCTALQLPYKGDRMKMILFLSETPEGFSQMEDKFDSFDFSSLNFEHKVKVDLFLPKFKLETSLSLVDPLKEMGLTKLFEEADFSNLVSSSSSLFVSSVMHKSLIEVNEDGTEAVAATGCTRETRSLPIEFRCDRPFLFAITDSLTGVILFVGRVVNPQEQ